MAERGDLSWWHSFIDSWNELSILRSESWSSPANHCIQKDASGSWGCGAFFEGKWLQWQWPNKWCTASIMAKKLVPITLSREVWGPKLLEQKYCSSATTLVLWLLSLKDRHVRECMLVRTNRV